MTCTSIVSLLAGNELVSFYPGTDTITRPVGVVPVAVSRAVQQICRPCRRITRILGAERGVVVLQAVRLFRPDLLLPIHKTAAWLVMYWSRRVHSSTAPLCRLTPVKLRVEAPRNSTSTCRLQPSRVTTRKWSNELQTYPPSLSRAGYLPVLPQPPSSSARSEWTADRGRLQS